MPRVVLFREANGEVPFVRWLDQLPQKSRDHVSVSIDRLRRLGHLLRRPEADYLVDGIYELRFRSRGLNCRILYFFHGREAIVVSHGFFKQTARVPDRELQLAIRRRRLFLGSPDRYTHGEE